MKGYGGPAQPTPLLGDALNAGYRYLEVKCDGCGTHNTVDLTIIRRPRETAVWPTRAGHALQAVLGAARLSLQMRHLVRLRRSKVTTKDNGEPWYPGDHRDRN